MIHYCLSPLRSLNLPGIPPGAVGPAANCIGMIDLRSLPGHSGIDFAFMAMDDTLGPIDADDRVIATAESPVHDLSISVAAKDRTTWADALGVTLAGGITTLADLLAATFLAGDPEGQTAVRPLTNGPDGFSIHLGGHSRVWHRPLDRGNKRDPFMARAMLVHAAEIRRVPDEVLRGKLLTDVLERGRFPVDRATAKDVLGIDEAPRKRQTSYSDDFARADAATLGASWTEQSTGWRILSNNALEDGGLGSNQAARYNSDLSSSDHYSEIVQGGMTGSFGDGPTARMSSSAWTYYTAYNSESDGNFDLFKFIADAATLISDSSTSSGSATIRCRVAGSTITGYRNGGSVTSTTDTAIASGTRCGMYTYSSGSHTVASWNCDDEAAVGQPFAKRWGGIPHNGLRKSGVW